MSYVVNLLKKPPNEILTPVSEFLLQQQLEDSQLYNRSDLLEGWTESLLGEAKLKLLASFRSHKEDWQERACLDRKINILKDIRENLSNPACKTLNERIGRK